MKGLVCSGTRRTVQVLGLLVLCLVLCVIKARGTLVMARDSFSLLEQAEAWQQGEWRRAVAGHYAPLQPLLVALGMRAGLTGEKSGQLLGVLASVACLLPLLWLAARWFGPRTAWWAGLCLACSPRLWAFAGEVLTEPLFFPLWLSALAGAWACWRRGGLARGLCAGLAVGLAYLARPEGAVLLVWALACAARARQGRARALLGVLLGFLLCAAPYVGALRLATGEWALARKNRVIVGSLAEASQGGPKLAVVEEYHADQDAAIRAGQEAHQELPGSALLRLLAENSGPVVRKLLSGFLTGVFVLVPAVNHPLWLLLAAVGVYACWRSRRHRRLLLFVCVPLLLHLAAVSVARPQKRYAAPSLLVVALLAGRGIDSGALTLRRRLGPRVARQWASAAGLLAVAVLLPELGPERLDRLWLRDAGQWLRAHGPPGAVYAADSRVAGYAGREAIPRVAPGFPGSADELIEYLESWRAGVLVLRSDRISAPTAEALAGERCTLLARWPAGESRWVHIYGFR